MAHGNRPELGRAFPDTDNGVIVVQDEKHRYEVFEGSNNSKLPKYEYTLNKSPVIEVRSVTGISGGSTKTFSKGSDYALNPLVSERSNTFTYSNNHSQYTLSSIPEDGTVNAEDESGDTYSEGTDFAILSVNGDENVLDWSAVNGSTPDDDENFTATYDVTFENSIIDWDQNGDKPDAGTFFEVTYTAKSIISRYLTSSENEHDSVEDELQSIIEGKFIDSASGNELDRIGKTFGRIGKREGRSDTQYRIYLKSVVQSFVSRGTKNGIKTAVSAATDVPLSDIDINENFQKNEYEVQVTAATPITGSLLEEVAEIADPSGVTQSRTRFTIPPEEIGIDDDSSTSSGVLAAQDGVDIEGDLVINDNKTTLSDEMGGDDVATVPAKAASESEEIGSDDSTSTAQTNAAWNIGDWNTMNWATEHN